MRCLVCPDTSEFQPPLVATLETGRFNRRVLIIRVAFGAHYQDRNFLAMATAVKWLYDRHVIDGALVYQVWLRTASPAEHFAFAKKLIGPVPPAWLIGVMLDLEQWNGQSYAQHGDHSAAINSLWAKFCAWGHSWTFCGLYGNQGDLANLAPRRDRRAWVMVASYGSRLVYGKVRGAIGQQYSDGQRKWAVPTVGGGALPRSSAGFRGAGGHPVTVACDHNVFDPKRFPNGAALRAFMRPAARPPVVKPPAPKPSRPPAGPPHYPHAVLARHDHALVAPAGGHAWIARDDGRIDHRHNGVHVEYIGGKNA